MRSSLAAVGLLLAVGCAPATPERHASCACPLLDRAVDLTGNFDVHVVALRTLSGPAIAVPAPSSSLPAHLERTEAAISGRIGDADWYSPVAANVALAPAATGCCPGPWSPAATQPATWEATDGVRVDTLSELGGALHAFDPTLTVEGPAGLDADEAGGEPVRIIDATGMSVTSTYFVRGPGCADARCASRVAVTYRFDRRAI